MGKIKRLDLQGKRFGRLTVLNRVKVPGSHNSMWECRCDCGNLTIGAGANIGKSKFSCGCLAKETARSLLKTHGATGTQEWNSWNAMRARCTMPGVHAYSEYGGRGISVCKEWMESFEAFLSDMGPKPSPQHSIDRIDTNGHYEPSNCRWATWEEQQNNRRNTVFVVLQNVKMTIRDAIKATKSDVPIARIHSRINAGWALERALSQPVGR